MKKLTKILLTSSLSLLLVAVSVVTYLHAQSNDDKFSNLTLANIEALGYDTIGESAEQGCHTACTHTYAECPFVFYDDYGTIVAIVICPGYYAS